MTDLQTPLLPNQPTIQASTNIPYSKMRFRLIAMLLDGIILYTLSIFIRGFINSVGGVIKFDRIHYFEPLIPWLYSFLFIFFFGATIGKMIVRIKVVDSSFKSPTILQIFIREIIGKIISSAFFNLGFAWSYIDSRNQTWHDKLAKTYVVSSKTLPLTTAVPANKEPVQSIRTILKSASHSFIIVSILVIVITLLLMGAIVYGVFNLLPVLNDPFAGAYLEMMVSSAVSLLLWTLVPIEFILLVKLYRKTKKTEAIPPITTINEPSSSSSQTEAEKPIS